MRSNNTFLKLVLVLSLLGVLVSGKLLSVHNRFSTGQASLTETCSIGGSAGCASIAVSEYSDVLGVPVAAIAMGFYFTLFFLGLWAMRNQQAANEALYTSFFLSSCSIVVTVAMFVISNFVLKSFCQYCAMLWVINLAIWPCLVKQLGLGWGNALSGNLELLGSGSLRLQRGRVLSSFGFGLACMVTFVVIGASAKGLQGQEMPQGESTLLSDYGKAQIVMLPGDAYGGNTSKGFSGSNGAPLMEIAELADFQCPGCKMAAQFLKPFLLKHKEKVRLTYHNFPLDGSCNPFAPGGRHTVACAAAKSGLCAAKQNKFWEFHDNVYDRQEELSATVIEDISVQIGLDMAAYQACLKDTATETALQKDMQLGEMIALESTPTLVINGKKLIGARSPADLEVLLKSLEKEAAAKR